MLKVTFLFKWNFIAHYKATQFADGIVVLQAATKKSRQCYESYYYCTLVAKSLWQFHVKIARN